MDDAPEIADPSLNHWYVKLPSPSASAMVFESESVEPSVWVPDIVRLPVGSSL